MSLEQLLQLAGQHSCGLEQIVVDEVRADAVKVHALRGTARAHVDVLANA